MGGISLGHRGLLGKVIYLRVILIFAVLMDYAQEPHPETVLFQGCGAGFPGNVAWVNFSLQIAFFADL